MRLQGKKALFFGGATGIGRATAIQFAQNGADLVIADLNIEGAKELAAQLAAEHGIQAAALPFDILDEESIKNAALQAEDIMGGITTVPIFAAMMRTGDIEEFSAETWDNLFAANVRGTFVAAKHTIPALKRAGGGSIITTSSLAGVRGAPGMVAYAATKGAVITFSKTLALELAADNIRVNSVLPGWIDTPFNNPAIDYMGGHEAQDVVVKGIVPLERQGTPEDVAPMYVFLASDESSYITAKTMLVDGGMPS